jgi:hypothetical protein
MAKKVKRPKVKKLTLDKSTVLHVRVPEGVAPVVVHHSDKIVVAPSGKEAEVGWWDLLFGTEKKTI